MNYPNGVVTSYGYDAESRLTSLGANLGATPITSFGYALDAVGNRTRKTTLDWIEDYTYDETYRLLSADRSSGTPARWRFAYDPVGNRGRRLDRVAGFVGPQHLERGWERRAGRAGERQRPAELRPPVSGRGRRRLGEQRRGNRDHGRDDGEMAGVTGSRVHG